MKRKIAVTILLVAILATSIFTFAGCQKADYTIGIMENSEHMSSDEVMRGFRETMTELMRGAGKKVSYVYRKSGGDDATKIAESEEKNAAELSKKKVNAILAISQSSKDAAVKVASEIPTVFAHSAIADRNLQEEDLKVQVQRQIDLMTMLVANSENKTLGILYCTTDELGEDGSVVKVSENKTKAEINQDLQVKIAEQYIKELGYEVAIYRYNKNEEKTHDTFVKDGLNELKNDHKVGCVFVPADNTLGLFANGPKIHQRANTNIYTSANGIEKREVASMPIVCGDIRMNSYFGVATYAFDNYALGTQAAQEVFEILVNGKQTTYSEFKTDFSKGKYVVNEQVAKDIGFEIPQSVKDLAQAA